MNERIKMEEREIKSSTGRCIYIDKVQFNEFESSSASGSDKVQCNCEPPKKDKKFYERGRFSGWYDFSEKSVPAAFFEDTSLHGLQYLGKEGLHLVERFLWIFTFGLSMWAAVYLIMQVWGRYLSSPVIVTFQSYETFINEIPFPAITICNMNKVLKSKAEEYMTNAKGDPSEEKTAEAMRNVFILDHVCSTTKSFSKRFNFSSKKGSVDQGLLDSIIKNRHDIDDGYTVAHFLQQSSQPCKDMIKLCLWQDQEKVCSDLFKPIETNFGKCCVFNQLPQSLLLSLLDDSRDKPKEIDAWRPWNDLLNSGSNDGLMLTGFDKPLPRRQRRAGKTSGLSILLNPDLDDYYCTSSDSFGFRMATHLPTDVPHVTDFGIAIKPNTEVFTSLRPDLTIADDSVGDYDTEKRHCYIRDEFKLHYYTHYTASNCFDECIANKTYEECQCVRYYMPRDKTRQLCGPDKFYCAEKIKQSSFVSGMKEICSFCRPTCTELSYSSDTTVSELQSDLWTSENDSLADWSSKNVSLVHVFFGEDSTYSKVRSQVYGWTDLVSNIGGLLGLCMGFSGLSLMEIFYYFTIRAWCSRRRRHALRKEEARRNKYGMKSDISSYVKPESTSKYENNVTEVASKEFVPASHSWTTESSKL